MRPIVVLLAFVPNLAFADFYTTGEAGIDSRVTGLDGTDIEIGQVEIGGRSAKANYDAATVAPANLKPTGVYFLGTGGMDPPDAHVHPHATRVAAVMIADSTQGVAYVGVAPKANLHSGGFAVSDDGEAALMMNRIATLGGAGIDIRAMNVSIGRQPQPFIENTDGKTHFTQFVDWSARQHDILYATGWPNNDDAAKSVPGDDYNGITVAASEESEPLSGYHRFGSINNPDVATGDAIGERTSIDLLAPGTNVQIANPDGTTTIISGTSEAIPHVTGTVALLQQYAQQQIDVPNPRFGFNSLRHEVMKAVILNSADKVAGVHGSDRTICDSPGTGVCHDWRESEAFSDATIPLDDKIGAGHLNARRAVQQFSSGEYSLAEQMPLIGWAEDTISPDQTYPYELSQEASGYVAITLAWDRVVNHSGGNTYEAGVLFFPYEDVDDIVNNLDLRLETADGMTILAESRSTEMNLEHIFFPLQTAGQYRIVVHHNGGLGTLQRFGLAWWFGRAGDYNGNGSVDPEDYDEWRENFGATVAAGTGADGNGNGVVDAADYVVWRNNLSAGSAAAVPEPGAFLLLAAIIACGLMTRQRRESTIGRLRHLLA